MWANWRAQAVAWEDFTKADLLLDGDSNQYDVWKLFQHAEVLDWFAKIGQVSFPSIAILARSYLAKPMSNAFQERVFSTAGHVLSVKRTALDASRAEKLQLLMHYNK